ncbi:glutaredoxin [Ketobacter sp. MCCC 1A13808]|uniref:glutaredoxin family protein n=1 Tax=Ketobacter sp. MCCC 1A13808 TaxID=2602738 RepID=UPI000F1F9BCE|nr:glutaredoxin [Ketobacter sp. MCCC 1A13808]MVF14192.1 glutaredoxin [Ketobacter sp. MCCC 1A13808]RLP54098.1 MAG: glutaredoxin [Ketobacter sp.]
MAKHAELYRMHTQYHICPYGLKSRALLRRENFEIDDHLLTTREQTEKFKSEYDVETTPQTFINGERVGGYSELKAYFGKTKEKESDTSYRPVIAIFSMAFLMAVALLARPVMEPGLLLLVELFVALSMCALAIQKLKDPEGFSFQFITYDLLGMRYPRYAYAYAFLEAFAGIGMLAMLPAWLVSPPAAFIGVVGAVSVFKAVYIDKRELKCACVGGDSNVPLGVISLTENLMMVAMAIWVWFR